MSERVKIWELSLLFALCISLCHATLETGRQSALSEKIIRLHVVASSDEAGAQALKMRVRDAVTDCLAPILAEADSTEEVGRLIEDKRDELLAAAVDAAQGESVELLWGRESYGYRQTEAYALPAGEYNSLRFIIGEGEGQNWWGVIFPQLDASGGYAEAAKMLSEDELELIYEDDGYQLRFKLLEVLQSFRRFFD